jgi:sigma-E factor negative regulatory protein RseA
MSEQIREQVSAFLDGELPGPETELLLKRLTRDGELRESFGRYALIGEAMRGKGRCSLSKGFASRINTAIDVEPKPAAVSSLRVPRWWRPIAGVAVAAGVAAVAVVALQQRAVAPALRAGQAVTAQNAETSGEPVSYTVPTPSQGAPVKLPAARLTNYVFAHSKYSSGLGQRGVLADMLIEDEEPVPAPVAGPAIRVAQ